MEGPSPRVRGNREGEPDEQNRQGSIPACAGKPPQVAGRRSWPWVHPRVCGETWSTVCRSPSTAGPSPRVRGNPIITHEHSGMSGSIPACAGKPDTRNRCQSPDKVHPRVCGETLCFRDGPPKRPGPSPRVRGNRREEIRHAASGGSIPACAGKPPRASTAAATVRVHPRVCGETVSLIRVSVSESGPSPRVRGNPIPAPPARRRSGSIPACAGKPHRSGRYRGRRRVHPRVCGETFDPSAIWSSVAGPSPRVRGNLGLRHLGERAAGSIPACAGKPDPRRPLQSLARVHPRVCGET